MILIIVGLIVLILLIIWGISTNNKLVRYRNEVEMSESQINVQLQRRADLIPNLVSTVKGYAKHEGETLAEVTKMRQQMTNPDATLNEKMQANDNLTSSISRLLVSVESYPELKANTNFLNLQEELTNTENKVSFTRASFNSVVKAYNVIVESFPASIIASMRGFVKKDYLEIPETSKVAPKVEF